jgi:2-octaprenyl-6-methoxyphenol hydroxylase
MTPPQTHDVIVAGAGLAGATFALAAASGGLRVALIDPQPFQVQQAETFDGRSTAIAWSTFRMLDALGIGERLRPHACRMDRILVTDGRRPPRRRRPPSCASSPKRSATRPVASPSAIWSRTAASGRRWPRFWQTARSI